MEISKSSPLRALKVSNLVKISRILLIIAIAGIITNEILAQSIDKPENSEQAKELSIIQGNSILPVSNPSLIKVKKINMVITAYSSTPEQTDEDPFITASGTIVEEGLVANNLLPFGTQIRIPELYGDKIFVVLDRMNQKKGSYHLDIWFSEYDQAKNFGAKYTYIEVLES